MTVKELLDKMPYTKYRLRDYTSGAVIQYEDKTNVPNSHYWDYEVVQIYARTHTWQKKTEAQIIIMIRANLDKE